MAIVLENTQSKGQAWTSTKTGEPACLITISCSVHAVKTMSRRDRTPGARLADTKRRFNGLLNFQKNCILECLSNEPDRFVRGRGGARRFTVELRKRFSHPRDCAAEPISREVIALRLSTA